MTFNDDENDAAASDAATSDAANDAASDAASEDASVPDAIAIVDDGSVGDAMAEPDASCESAGDCPAIVCAVGATCTSNACVYMSATPTAQA